MQRFVREVEEEGGIARPLDELQHVLGEHIGDIALGRCPASVDVEQWIQRLALTAHCHPAIEARPRAVVVAHVPLADERGLVATRLQGAGKRRQPVAGLVACQVVGDSVGVGVEPGEERRAARRAQRGRGEGVAKLDPLACNAIDVGRLHERVAAGTEIVPAHVVDQHDDHVGPLGRGSRRPGARGVTRADERRSQDDAAAYALGGGTKSGREMSLAHGQLIG